MIRDIFESISVLVFAALMYLSLTYPFYIIAKKNNVKNSWMAFVPLLNFYSFVKSAGKPGWWVLLFLIPGINIIFLVLCFYEIAKRLNKPEWLGIFSAFIPFLAIALATPFKLESESKNETKNLQVSPVQGPVVEGMVKKTFRIVVCVIDLLSLLFWLYGFYFLIFLFGAPKKDYSVEETVALVYVVYFPVVIASVIFSFVKKSLVAAFMPAMYIIFFILFIFAIIPKS